MKVRWIGLTGWLAAGMMLTACSQNASESPASMPPGPITSAPALSESEMEEIHGGKISGTITIAPALGRKLADTDVVYIIARSADLPGPPIAVQQLRNVRFPLDYSLTSADAMMPGTVLQGSLNVVVRLDRDGAAGPPQPGDMEGVYPGNPAQPGDEGVDIEINKEF